jgi:hypothetical protein
VPVSTDRRALAEEVPYPCVVKPLGLSGSRGVMRADDPFQFVTAFERLRALLESPDVRSERSGLDRVVLVEGFIPGPEVALEGLMSRGLLQPLAIFDKPDPLEGPFFEETLYVTPSRLPDDVALEIVDSVHRAAAALGLDHGPVHAECRVDGRRVFVLELAARPIGGLCARALRFVRDQAGASEGDCSLEELLLRHALGEPSEGWRREAAASGVMMIPIPRRGVLRGVSGIGAAEAVPGVTEVRVTAKFDHLLVPLPEGATYLGFIFARASTADEVERALRAAHAHLVFAIDAEVPVLQSRHG